jgi:hypothetical protein
MSIYCTLWELRFPRDGDSFECAHDPGIVIIAKAVPQHIDDVGPAWDFLPPPVAENAPNSRAVVFVTAEHEKLGTVRNGQEYVNPLLTLSGKQYDGHSFNDLYETLCERLRERYPVKDDDES